MGVSQSKTNLENITKNTIDQSFKNVNKLINESINETINEQNISNKVTTKCDLNAINQEIVRNSVINVSGKNNTARFKQSNLLTCVVNSTTQIINDSEFTKQLQSNFENKLANDNQLSANLAILQSAEGSIKKEDINKGGPEGVAAAFAENFSIRPEISNEEFNQRNVVDVTLRQNIVNENEITNKFVDSFKNIKNQSTEIDCSPNLVAQNTRLFENTTFNIDGTNNTLEYEQENILDAVQTCITEVINTDRVLAETFSTATNTVENTNVADASLEITQENKFKYESLKLQDTVFSFANCIVFVIGIALAIGLVGKVKGGKVGGIESGESKSTNKVLVVLIILLIITGIVIAILFNAKVLPKNKTSDDNDTFTFKRLVEVLSNGFPLTEEELAAQENGTTPAAPETTLTTNGVDIYGPGKDIIKERLINNYTFDPFIVDDERTQQEKDELYNKMLADRKAQYETILQPNGSLSTSADEEKLREIVEDAIQDKYVITILEWNGLMAERDQINSGSSEEEQVLFNTYEDIIIELSNVIIQTMQEVLQIEPKVIPTVPETTTAL